MSITSYIQAMPKADVHLHLEGALPKTALLGIADRNDIADSIKHFSDWVKMLDQPDPKRIHDIAKMTSTWFQHPDDLTRAAYDLGTWLAKQNVRYAEVTVNPALYTEIPLQIEAFFAALNDGRERARRAWGIEMTWILAVPRDEPRRADDFARWVTTAVAKRANVLGLGLSGREDGQAIGQFERAFRAVEKKEFPRIARAGDVWGAEGVAKAVEMLVPTRLEDAWGVIDAPDVLKEILTQEITLAISLVRAVKHGWVASIADYPLRRLYDAGVDFVIGTDMPGMYKNRLADELSALVENLNFSVEEMEHIALNAVRRSLLPEEQKTLLLEQFMGELEALRAEHLQPEAK